MILILLGCLVACLLQLSQAAGCNRIMCYHTNWSQYRRDNAKFLPENIDPSLCTHVIYAFAKISGNHLAPFEFNDDSTDWSVGMYQQFVNLKQKNAQLKTMLAVGGGSLGSGPFTQIVGSPSNRKEFITQSISYLRKRGFDGLDLDWEFPASGGSPPQDKQHFTELVTEMRQAFDAEARTSGKSRLLLSAAVSGGKETVDTAYDVAAIAKALDFINLMTYDFHGSWESNAGHNSPLYPRGGESGWQLQLNVDWAARYWVQKGAPKEKLNIGMGLYGRSFTLASASNHQPGAPAPQPGQAGPFTGDGGVLAYYEVCDMLKAGATRVFIADQQVPYAYHGTQWVGYDDPESLRDKVRYVKQNGYGGVMVWELSMDDFTGVHCNNGHFPLMHAINSECGQSTAPGVTKAPSTTAHPAQHTTHAAVVTTQKSTSSGHNTAVTCSNKADGFYTSPRSCNEYITCAAGVAYIIKCAEGLVYNANLHVCDWPANYHCTI